MKEVVGLVDTLDIAVAFSTYSNWWRIKYANYIPFVLYIKSFVA